MKKTIEELAELFGGKVIGDASKEMAGVGVTSNVTVNEITFAENAKYLKEAEERGAGAIVVSSEVTESKSTLIQVANPRVAFAQCLELFYPLQKPAVRIHSTAIISEQAQIGNEVAIGPYVVIEAGAQIGDRVVIGAGGYIGQDVKIDDDGFIYPSVTIHYNIVIGKKVIIHSGTVLGGDGFGYADKRTENGVERIKIPQIGNVVIEDNVELGCNVCIDRGTIGETLIKKGTKVDNLVQIAHNVQISDHAILCAQVGVSGSSTIGLNTVLAGQVGIGDHVRIANDVIIGAQSGVPTKKKIREKTVWFGCPARPIQDWKESFAYLQRAQKLTSNLEEKIKALEVKIEALETEKSTT